jgi:Mrp family chromosome partitioning ATPase
VAEPPKRSRPNTLTGTGGQPGVTAPMSTVKKPTPVKGTEVNKVSHEEEWTRTMGPEDKKKPKFIEPDDPNLATAITGMTANAPPAKSQSGTAHAKPSSSPKQPQLTSTGAPMGGTTLKDMPAQGGGPLVSPRATLRDLPVHSALTVREPSLDLPVVVDQMIAQHIEPTAEIQKAKVWVATHKPPADPDARLIMLNEPDSARAASFRVLRHRLAERGDPRTIVITSAVAGEGKTTCAANLAMALGECGRAKVLLVEANLRRPSLAALFGFLPPECFSIQLGKHRDKPLEPWSVVEAFTPSLHVLAVKPGPENEDRPLLDGVAFGNAMDMLKRSGYDYIVIDTPSVLGSADVNLAADFSDGILLTTWARKSSSRDLRRALDQLAPAKLLGVTLLDA